MIKINVKSDIERVLGNFARQYPRAAEIARQRAIVGTANVVKAEVVKEMGRIFDKPKPWTLNAYRVALGAESMQGGQMRPRAGGPITARVEIKDGYWYRAQNYLATQIEGAANRRMKAFESALQRAAAMPQGWRAVPGEKAKLDEFGNHSPGEIRQILSYFDAAEHVAGSRQNMGAAGRARRRSGTRRTAGWEYFIVGPGGRRQFIRSNGRTGSHSMQPGIYRRTFHAMGTRIEPIMIFVKSASYKKRFDLEGVGRRTVARELDPRLRAALAIEIARIQQR